MSKCCVKNCPNYSKNSILMFMSFPKDDRRQKWEKFAGIKHGLKHHYRICEIHFDDSQWIKKSIKLKPDAVPTIQCNCSKDSCKQLTEIEDIRNEHSYFKRHTLCCTINYAPKIVFPNKTFFREARTRQICDKSVL